jgi:hypothetical protein
VVLHSRLNFINFLTDSENIKMKDLRRDVLIGVMLLTGVFGFISGEFIVSTVLFAAAAIYSNVALSRQYAKIS